MQDFNQLLHDRQLCYWWAIRSKKKKDSIKFIVWRMKITVPDILPRNISNTMWTLIFQLPRLSYHVYIYSIFPIEVITQEKKPDYGRQNRPSQTCFVYRISITCDNSSTAVVWCRRKECYKCTKWVWTSNNMLKVAAKLFTETIRKVAERVTIFDGRRELFIACTDLYHCL